MADEDENIDQAIKLLKKKDKKNAHSLLLKAVKINPKSEQAWTLLAESTDESAERLRYLKRADKIKRDKAAVQDEIRELQSKASKPKKFWNKTNRLRAGLIFLVFTLIPFLWWLYQDVLPTIWVVNRMMGEWNVAVAGFTGLDTDLQRADIVLISNVFSNRFSQEMELLGNDANLVVQVWGPQQVDQSISGDSVEKRAIEAEKLAAKLNADMLIYGIIQQTDNGYVLQPEFYIRAENYYEADELIGQHRFGGQVPILATRDNLPAQLPLNIELTRRSKILALTARGLSLYLVHSYDLALQLFTQANQDEFWQNSAGRETIYLFQGNAAIRMKQVEEAQKAYEQAIAVNPDYGRGYIGLGNVYYFQASESASQSSFSPNQKDMAKAKDYFQHAIQIADQQPASAEITSKAAFGLGQVYLVEWILSGDYRDLATENFHQVLANYADEKKPQLQELASEAHARLAIIERQDKNLQAALSEFQNALDLSTLPERKGLYWASLSDLYQKLGESEQAVNANRQAIEQYQLALALPMPDSLKAYYWARIGDQYAILKETAQAIAAYEQALSLVPADSADYITYQQRFKTLKP